MKPIQQAIEFILQSVDDPAMESQELEKKYKNKVASSKRLVRNFKKVGDLYLYLRRFADNQQAGEIYDRMQGLGLKTYEDILPEFENRFGGYRFGEQGAG